MVPRDTCRAAPEDCWVCCRNFDESVIQGWCRAAYTAPRPLCEKHTRLALMTDRGYRRRLAARRG